MAEMIVTKENFQSRVLASEKPVLLDFWAAWCGPCRMLGPVVEELAGENENRFWVGKVNVDEEGDLAAAFRVTSIPSLFLMKDGKVLRSTMGFMPKRALQAWVDEALGEA